MRTVYGQVNNVTGPTESGSPPALTLWVVSVSVLSSDASWE
jgi:hypothetical protein